MTDRPILFKAEMVKAICQGRKTQTRRVLKDDSRRSLCVLPSETQEDLEIRGWGLFGDQMCNVRFNVGDRLWVKESWRGDQQMDGIKPRDFSAGEPIFYEANKKWRIQGCHPISEGRKRPSIFMTRAMSRLTLVVTDVRAQHLQDISEDDAKAEGVSLSAERRQHKRYRHPNTYQFRELWDGINDKRGYGWMSNPWVCAIAFEPVFQNIDAIRAEAAQ